MERLLTKIRDLEKEALNIASKQERKRIRIKETNEECCWHCEGQDWINDVRLKGGEWTGKPLVVLSLFDGIGGVWVALERLGIPFVGYSCEVNDAAMQVIKHRYGMVRHLGDVKELEKADIPEKVDLIIGGFPCQDLSSLGHKMGLHGQRSKLFFEMLRIIKIFNPTWFLAENVASMTWIDRQEISKHLNTTPIEIDAEEITPSKRRRIYWSNIPYPNKIPRIRDHESTALQSVLHNATALDKKVGCILSQNNHKAGYGSLELVMDNNTNKLRYISVIETELAMGYPPGYTNVKFNHSCEKKTISSTANYRTEVNITNITRRAGEKMLRSKRIVQSSQRLVEEMSSVKSSSFADGINRSARWHLLGNTFSVPVICYLLSPLLYREVRAAPIPISLPKYIKEQDCSAMDPGEVWALYNSHERPNWYAVIVSRSGDRFSDVRIQLGRKRPPIYIEVKFMEMTSAYAAGEPDNWDTNRGTGLFHLRELIDKQNSWVAFSHRVSTFLHFDNHYFMYPGKDEVWAIYDNAAKCRYLVYVLTSEIDRQKAKLGKPGKEGFHARCRLLQRTENEVYRFMDAELDLTDLSIFAFRAPFHYKNESNLLRIELTLRQRKQGPENDKQNCKRRKRYSDSDEDDEEDEVEATDSEAVVTAEDDSGR
ncbi:protein MpDNMT3a [Marchantia polymorpha subsp. ruderalis]|uniref:DNA (cytosine-5-)-methyltransferase n=2 Tax=Marchantia polymorpha TaxID=3197 RepID=A0AAF6AM39_MARPO|nr:hypothetical protein MARPO_0043s0021 [Marchantia polymorpha]BBM97509.1 hypothetical protein Mp_1g06290 [Marchantia polymorpha subsp. ruderalis]|eukprot:PTQ39748.1 hypothetical protein MARPO_0043s0021 [Marchantia polymorpha]